MAGFIRCSTCGIVLSFPRRRIAPWNQRCRRSYRHAYTRRPIALRQTGGSSTPLHRSLAAKPFHRGLQTRQRKSPRGRSRTWPHHLHHRRISRWLAEHRSRWSKKRHSSLARTGARFLRKVCPEEKSRFRFLFSYLKPYKKHILQLLVGLVAGSLLQLIFPFLTNPWWISGSTIRILDLFTLFSSPSLSCFSARPRSTSSGAGFCCMSAQELISLSSPTF